MSRGGSARPSERAAAVLGRWSIPVKAMMATVVVLAAVGVVEAWGVARAVRATFPAAYAAAEAEAARNPEAPARLRARVALVMVGCAAFCTACAGLWAAFVVRRRTARLTRALGRIARGELRAELEPSLDTDLVVVREALLRMQDALDALTSRLAHTDAQRRRLFADLAHELATPTSTILGIAEALAGRSGTEADRARHVAFLEQEATRLERLVGDVRDLARLDDPDVALELARVDVGELARRAAERLNAASSAPRATIRCRVEGAAVAQVDPVRVDQVLVNLLTNAQRYAPPDGAIELAVRADGERVRIVVEDSGPGVPDSVLPMLGERLLRLDPSRSSATGGHGLGLSIVSAAVHRHGGTLAFGRATLGGLRATIELPVEGA